MLGRFGWKAGQPTLLQQSSSALAGDIGVSNPLAPVPWGECSEAEQACREAPNGNSPQYEDLEAPTEVMDKILFYVRHLAVPGAPRAVRRRRRCTARSCSTTPAASPATCRSSSPPATPASRRCSTS